MKDFATSDHAGVQAQLDRLAQLSVPQGRFGLETSHALLDRLGNPHLHLPPVFHVAGTNGKGSTCTYLRYMLAAQGLRVHTATKPHLVRYNERIRLAGALIDDELLAALLAEALDAGADLAPSFFEITTAAMFMAFARVPADVCVIETGLGGRLDATNVIVAPAVCGIATLGIDHEAFLLVPEAGTPAEPIARIAYEKASIGKPGVPLVTQCYADLPMQQVERTAATRGAPVLRRDRDWSAEVTARIAYRDAWGTLGLPLPALPGAHQADNAALAVAMLRHQRAVTVTPAAMAQGITTARWPARLQQLGPGPLTDLARGHGKTRNIWLDGGHNRDAGQAIARHLAGSAPVHVIIGMLANKDPGAMLVPLGTHARSVTIVPAPGHDAHLPAAFAPFSTAPISSQPDVASALAALPGDGDVLITGSLYLAGDVLRRNGELPD